MVKLNKVARNTKIKANKIVTYSLCFFGGFFGSVSVYLGYDVETLRSRSWYSLLHPRDLTHASAQHCTLCKFNCGNCGKSVEGSLEIKLENKYIVH